LDGIEYGLDPLVKLRVEFTIQKSGLLPVKIGGLRVTGYLEEDGWGKVYLVAYEDINYHGHFYRCDEVILAWVPVTSRKNPGTMHLTQR
jgi:hypothetical protein